MKSTRNTPSVPVEEPIALEAALTRSLQVEEKVTECAVHVGSANDSIKEKISVGQTTLPAQSALVHGKEVESMVQECAEDLTEVNKVLVQGIDNLKSTEATLAESQAALATSEAALAMARLHEQAAHHQALHDAATGLPNRTLFDDRLVHAIDGGAPQLEPGGDVSRSRLLQKRQR